MKQVVQNYKSGELALLDVPVPGCKPGGVLVRSAYSLISTGTELMKVSEAGMSMVGKARSRPDQVAKVVQSVATNGVPATYRKVMGKLDSYTPLGYSLCGVVEEVGSGVDDVKVGDLVACAGNEHALHAELNWVPKNLYTPVPDGLAPRHAAFGTVGSIAMQGVRQGEPQLGEVALVIGLGLIGQLVVQLLAASGVRVIGVDPEPARCELAERTGAAACGDPASAAVEAAVAELTGGHGVDQVYLAAAAAATNPSSWPPGSAGTAAGSSTSASAAWTCRGTRTTRRSSTSGSPAATAPGATTRRTSWRDVTTRSATCAGPSAATWRASLILSPAAASTWSLWFPTSPTSTTPSRHTSASRAAT